MDAIAGLILVWLASRLLWLDATAKRGKGCAANRVLVELGHLLESACLFFLGVLPTFTVFRIDVNQ